MPQYIEFPLKDRETWKKIFLPRLDPESPNRIPCYWESLKRQYAARDFPLGVSAGSIFGWPRDWMGVENIAVMLYDDPDLVKEMMDHIADLVVEVLAKVVFDVQFDFAVMWEDMAYKTGSLISPAHVRKLMVPNYRKITDLLHRAVIDVVMLDSDGNVEELIPLWLEAGINMLWPFERQSGMDPLEVRQEYGHDLIIMGGIDKRALIPGGDVMRREVDRAMPLVEDGGYFPELDHSIPPDVSWPNFCFIISWYLGLL